MKVASVYLNTASWYGHPEERRVAKLYNEAKAAAGAKGPDMQVPVGWRSTLNCWFLLDENGRKIARAYEPTETTRHWVWVDYAGNNKIAPPVSMARMTALMVEYRLKGGVYDPAL